MRQHLSYQGLRSRCIVFMVLLMVNPSITSMAYTATTVAEPTRITHGIASGDVTATEAVIWARDSRATHMDVGYTPAPAITRPPLRHRGPTVDASSDFTGKVLLQELTPYTRTSIGSASWLPVRAWRASLRPGSSGPLRWMAQPDRSPWSGRATLAASSTVVIPSGAMRSSPTWPG
jgi:alkaline phosphatase D